MSKDIEKKIVGQPIFKQIIDFLPKNKFGLREVTYKDEDGRVFEFITNNFTISAEEGAFLYKKRWKIELLFKKLKQNFQLHYFYSETENGIKTQVWCTLIAHLLLQVLRLLSKTQKAFSTVAALVRIFLISHFGFNLNGY